MNIKNNAELTAGTSFTQNSGNDVLTELVPVTINNINGREIQTVSAKKLHTYLNVGNDFSTWIKGRIDEYGFVTGDDFITFDSSNFRNQSTENNQSIKPQTKRGGDRRSKDYLLSIGMAKELAMVERNEQGRAIRNYFIQCEEKLKQVAPTIHKQQLSNLKARIKAASYSQPMCDALRLSRLEHGKDTKPHHYTTEHNLINKLVLGMTAKEYADLHYVKGNIRDTFSTERLEHIAYLEKTNITLIELGWDYYQRKDELLRLSQRYLAKCLGVNYD